MIKVLNLPLSPSHWGSPLFPAVGRLERTRPEAKSQYFWSQFPANLAWLKHKTPNRTFPLEMDFEADLNPGIWRMPFRDYSICLFSVVTAIFVIIYEFNCLVLGPISVHKALKLKQKQNNSRKEEVVCLSFLEKWQLIDPGLFYRNRRDMLPLWVDLWTDEGTEHSRGEQLAPDGHSE